MNYYFLVSSLPMLHLRLKPLITLKAFLSACARDLPPEDLAVMSDLLASDGAHSSHPFAQEWRDRETELRNEVARLRARHRLLSPEVWLRPQRGDHLFNQTAVADAFQTTNPLERERSLDQFRWTILGDLAGLNPFSIEAVFCYGLRLRLACRWAAFDPASGTALLERVATATAEASGNRASAFNSKKARSA
ncbi:MAG: DUF2764 family protein [bacterium]